MKRIIVAVTAMVLMLSLSACGYKGGKSTDKMKEYEFLFEIMEWEKCGHDRTKTHGWYYDQDGNHLSFDPMEDISDKLSDEVTVEVIGIESVDGKNVLRYSVHNGRDELIYNPFETPEIAVLLEGEWYRVPEFPIFVDEESVYNDIESGQSAETWVGLGNDYTELLPEGNYRLMLSLLGEYDAGEYAVVEFEIKADK